MAQARTWSALESIAAAPSEIPREPIWVTTQPEVKLPKPNTHEIQVPQAALVLIPLCFVCVWAIAAIVVGFPKASREKNLALKHHTKIPCRTCQFYSNNPYIRCALRPTEVLTEQAIDCTDYKAAE